jgi:hypothetical protein
MKSIAPLFLACLLITVLPGRSQNLLTNGNFESGALTPWVATGMVSVGAAPPNTGGGQFACAFSAGGLPGSGGGTVTQTAVTKAGALYYLGFDADPGISSSVVVSATPFGSNTADGTRTVFPTGVATMRFSLLFTASSNSTVVSLQSVPFIGTQVIDNITLIELPPNPHAGRYTGLVLTQTSSVDDSLGGHASAKFVARIRPTGEIILIQGGTAVSGGMLFPDGTVSLHVNNADQTATAKFKGSRISFSFSDVPTSGLGEGQNDVDFDQDFSYTLTKVGK